MFVRLLARFARLPRLEPASPRPLAWLRIGLCAVLLFQAVSIADHVEELYGNDGIVRWSISESFAPTGVPTVRWLKNILAPWRASNDTCVWAVFIAYVASVSCLLVGWRTRWSAGVAWLTHLALFTSGMGGTYGVDLFARIGLFYCLLMPVGHALSLDCSAGRVSSQPSESARLSLWLLRLHLCVVYLSSGLAKAAGSQWYDGEAIWQATMRPDAGPLSMAWLASVPLLAVVAGWSVLVVEIGYSVFAWLRWTRRPWVLATVGMHAGIALTLNLWSFAVLMIVLSTAAFLVPAEPAPVPGQERAKGEGDEARCESIEPGLCVRQARQVVAASA